MKVFVTNKHGQPLMPTTQRKAHLLLKAGAAKVAKRAPFAIQLVYGSSGYKQPVAVEIDARDKAVGFRQSQIRLL